ncbi:MAG TPA: sigma-54 dependent transcriptional regulator [Roseateles sp.]|nr:sigma-54 dependent transcriptional regulator [Roseateles sp.]
MNAKLPALASAIDWPNNAVLVVDDEVGMRNFLTKTLAPRCGQVLAAESAEAGETLVAQQRFDLIILDISLPGKPGLAWLRELREQGNSCEVILITAFADLDTAIEALRIGASDFILKPFRVTQLLNAVKHSLERARLARENFVLRRTLAQQGVAASGLIGNSAQMQALRQSLARAAPVDSTVLLSGESGTGKELAALALHRGSARARGPFVPVSCALMSPETVEAELFGHATAEGGARDGLLYYAQGGTLFLDEVAELPPAAQGKLLRLLEERRIRPVGSEQQIALDLRIIAASNRDLGAEVAAGRLRKDLYYRLQVVELHLPPLREHKEDIPGLVAHFIAELAPRLGLEPIAPNPQELDYLQQYDWPGNVRELRNLVERSLILGSLNLSALYPSMPPAAEPAPAPTTDLHTLERRHILAVLNSVQGDKAQAARLLGISKRTLERRFAEWNLQS